ncbi:MAG: DUF4250 domain-containing protein [Muribaculaceae bacterium]|nr:DUF4250 domain-containing protein [Muribaculaceae bacterium]
MNLPQDSNMLASIVNMKLRDGNYDSLSDLCLSLGIDEADLKHRLAEAGFEYNPEIKQFR